MQIKTIDLVDFKVKTRNAGHISYISLLNKFKRQKY